MKTNRNLWPLGIFVTFGLFFAGMTGVVVIAATHRDSLVNGNYYEQELKFQGQIDAAARAVMIDVPIEARYAPNVYLSVAYVSEGEMYSSDKNILDIWGRTSSILNGVQSASNGLVRPQMFRILLSDEYICFRYFHSSR